MKHSHLPSYLWPLRAMFLIALVGTGLTCKGGRSPGSTNAAPALFAYGDLDQNGNFLPVSNDPSGGPVYRPYYETGDMNTPRYLHQSLRLKNGLIFITGGTDERGFSALDTAEIFDETLLRKGERAPPSKTGSWIDTDFAGNPMMMENRRFWHTMNTLPDNRVLLLGGAANWLKARPTEKVEVFNLETRAFETLKDAKMVKPRVRHTVNTLPDGNIIAMGGLVHDVFVEIVQGQISGGGVSGGTITQQFQIDIFPSTNTIEVFSFTDLTLSYLTLKDSSRQSLLTSVRGRAGHVSVQFAGFDDKMKTGDDLLFIVGGFQTPSRDTGALVQQIMIPHSPAPNTSLKNIEIFDPTAQA